MNHTGIIYCYARHKAEEVASKLKDYGLKAEHFHAGLKPSEKKCILGAWHKEEIKIIVGTVGFMLSRGSSCFTSTNVYLGCLWDGDRQGKW
jgi:superfamily II DNA helicase RecQ